jgi:hypothetical protein
MNKPFDPELYNRDDSAKHLITAWLTQLGYQATINPDRYGIDVLADKDDRRLGFEVEVKHAWTGRTFPFATIHIADRKRKFAEPGNHFIMLNHERNRILAIRAETVMAAPTVTKKTIYTENEGFIEIQRSDCRFFEIGEPPQ